MIETLDLARSERLSHSWLSVEFHGGSVTRKADEGEFVRVVPGFTNSEFIRVWLNTRWACIVGEGSREVVVADARHNTLEIVGELERLDLRDTYNPGGLERVDFVEVDADRTLIDFEVGIAMLSRVPEILWQKVHEDLSCRISEITSSVVRVQCADQGFELRLSDGTVGNTE